MRNPLARTEPEKPGEQIRRIKAGCRTVSAVRVTRSREIRFAVKPGDWVVTDDLGNQLVMINRNPGAVDMGTAENVGKRILSTAWSLVHLYRDRYQLVGDELGPAPQPSPMAASNKPAAVAVGPAMVRPPAASVQATPATPPVAQSAPVAPSKRGPSMHPKSVAKRAARERERLERERAGSAPSQPPPGAVGEAPDTET
jgi:hypothetical protein